MVTLKTTMDADRETAIATTLNRAGRKTRHPRHRFVAASMSSLLFASLFSVTLIALPVAAANPAYNLDQCANGKLSPLVHVSPCDWENGNLGASKAHYAEGESIGYRAILTNIPNGAHVLELDYDVLNGGKHAIDFLTHYQRISETVDPCLGYAACTAVPQIAVPLPAGNPVGNTQPGLAFNALPAPERAFTMFKVGAPAGTATVTGITYFAQNVGSASNQHTTVRVAFTALNTPTLIMGWGGHIATTADWGAGNAAAGISGSSYHMRILGLSINSATGPFSGGNQDRSLGTAAVIPATPLGASLTIVKTVDNTNGGTAVPADFTMHVRYAGNLTDIPSSPQPGDSLVGNVYLNVPAGDYIVTEDAVAGYTQQSITGNCAADGTITLVDDQIAECTVTNAAQLAQLTVIKHVVNLDGGTLAASDWTMSVTGGSPSLASFPGLEAPGTNVTLLANAAYSVGESGPAGYAFAYSGDCTSTVGIPPGQTRTCTVTNDDIAPTLTVIKHIANDDGGQLQVADVELKIDGTAATNATAYTLLAGPHVVSEVNPVGYAASAWSGDCAADGTITLALDEDAICEITNDDIAPTLTVVKHVVNDDGGDLQVDQVVLRIDGTDAVNGTAYTMMAGEHAATEVNPAGYAASAWSGDCAADGSITLALDEDAVCEITNDDIAPTLTIVKHIVNDSGGDLQVDQVVLRIDGIEVANGTARTLMAGLHAATEVNPVGYAGSAWSGDCAADGSITLALDEDAVCEITNDDIAPTLTLVKYVVNDAGGDLQVDQVVLRIDGVVALNGTAYTLMAGPHTASEDNPVGYAASVWTGACAADGTITLALDQDAVCEVTDDDIAPTLTLVKHVVNDDGGTLQVSDVVMRIDGELATNGTAYAIFAGGHDVTEENPAGYAASGWSGACAADGSVSLVLAQEATCEITNDDIAPTLTVIKHIINDSGGDLQVDQVVLRIDGTAVANGTATTMRAGLHTVTEDAVAGYAASAWSGDCAADGTITLALDEDAICEITNDDIAPTLTLVKHVINDSGGALLVSEVVLRIDGADALNGTAYAMMAGLHAASEVNPVGYAASAWSGDCAADGSITLALDEDAICEITNDDIAPTLTLVKHVINDSGGALLVSEVVLRIDGADALNGTAYTLMAGPHAVTEVNPVGYAASAWSGDCAADGLITLALDQDAICEITNDDIAPTLTLVKHVVNDDGGTLQVSDVVLRIDGTDALNGTAYTLMAGEHAASEVNPAGYAASAWTGACAADGTITLTLAQDAVCEITDDDVAPILRVVKLVRNDNLGTSEPSDFLIHVAGVGASPAEFEGSESGVIVGLDAGAYQVTEVQQPGYVASFSADCTGTLVPGDDKTCTITNDDLLLVTRTQGFWSTHTAFTKRVFATQVGGSMPIGTTTHLRTIDTDGKLFGAWYSDIAKMTVGGKRLPLDQARMQLLQQLVTAKLNCAAFGCDSVTQAMIAQADTAYAGTNAAAILASAAALDAYNNSGDATAIPPSLGVYNPATSALSKALANKVFWNSP